MARVLTYEIKGQVAGPLTPFNCLLIVDNLVAVFNLITIFAKNGCAMTWPRHRCTKHISRRTNRVWKEELGAWRGDPRPGCEPLIFIYVILPSPRFYFTLFSQRDFTYYLFCFTRGMRNQVGAVVNHG
jgi:hypothetical protein